MLNTRTATGTDINRHLRVNREGASQLAEAIVRRARFYGVFICGCPDRCRKGKGRTDWNARTCDLADLRWPGGAARIGKGCSVSPGATRRHDPYGGG